MTDDERRLFTLANTAALVLFNDNGSPPTITLSQKVLAQHGASLLTAYRETVVAPAMTELGRIVGDSIARAVKKSCLQGDDCGWPICGCDCQIFARDLLSQQPQT